jgi:ATP/maltotriose-dependent transcriptional regulator MalT/DNA-binding SARP family transcriptional activator
VNTRPRRSQSQRITRPSPAKLAPPATHQRHLRERLHQRLRQLAATPLLWLAAPAGYGKTTLVASYLQASVRSHIWYQCDPGDADIASFFYYLSMAREKFTPKSRIPLPAFLPEHYTAIPTFTRNFFRSLFASFEGNITLVFDNFQEVPADATLMQMLPVLAEQVPADVQIIVISRGDPGPALSRWMAGEQLALLSAEDLKLSRTETEEVIAAAGVHLPADRVRTTDELYALSQGWAAGLTLLLRLDPKGGVRADGGAPASQAVFDYFAAEVFSRLSDPLQEFLLETSCLEVVPADVAERLTGRSEAQSILQRLVHDNVFTSYLPTARAYQYHPLFRSFLQSRARQRNGAAFDQALLTRAARALADGGDVEAGIGLYLQGESWEAAADLIERAAADLVTQARIQTLAAWIDALPPPIVERRAWLIYWRGIYQFTTSFVDARATLELAHALFCRDANPLGQMLTCAAILRHINYCYADYLPMLPWIERLSALFKNGPSFPSASIELQITAGFLLSISQAMPDNPDLRPLIGRVTELTSGAVDTASRAAGISALQHFFAGVGRTTQYRDLDRRIADILNDPRLAPMSRLQILWLHAYQYHLSGDSPLAFDLLQQAMQIAEHHGLVGESKRLRVCQLQAGDPTKSAREIAQEFAELEPMARRMPPIALAQFLCMRAMHEYSMGHVQDALQLVQESIPLIDGAHWPLGGALAKLGAAEVLFGLGRYDEALQFAAAARASANDLDTPLLDFNRMLVEAAVAGRTGPASSYAKSLARALELGRQQGYANSFHHGCRLLRQLIPDALRLGVEVSYCRWVIGKRGWPPPPRCCVDWPWAVRIRALGPLEIELNDAPLQMAGKAPRKPLELLKALLTSRRGLDAAAAMDLFWPELEGDAARNAFDLAVHRLRKLLKCNEAVLSVQGQLTLNPNRVWVDAFELERILDRDFGDEDGAELATQALQLYRAPLLSGDSTSWVVDARDRMRNVFLRIAKKLTDSLVEKGEWSTIRQFCDAAIPIGPGDEALYRAWIRSLVALGLEEEAKLASRQREEALSKQIGRAPAVSTKHSLGSSHSLIRRSPGTPATRRRRA